MSAEPLVTALRAAGKTITTVESCTGGLIAAAITSVSGSSAVFNEGFITYSNNAKTKLVHVPPTLITQHGAVSEHVAIAMAQGGLAATQANIAISVTGIAGPDGGSVEKPVGTVWIGIATKNGTTTHHHQFTGNRTTIRKQSVEAALMLALNALKAPI